MGFLYQINISKKGGVPKLPIQEGFVNKHGIVGDKQKNKTLHGGPERALCLFSLKEIRQLQKEGHHIFPGSTGENFTLDYDEYSTLTPGTKLKIGKVLLIEISSYTAPCKTIKASFIDENFNRMSQKKFPGCSRIYARVLTEGKINQGDKISIMY